MAAALSPGLRRAAGAVSRCVSRACGRHRGEHSWNAPGTKTLQEGFSEEEESPALCPEGLRSEGHSKLSWLLLRGLHTLPHARIPVGGQRSVASLTLKDPVLGPCELASTTPCRLSPHNVHLLGPCSSPHSSHAQPDPHAPPSYRHRSQPASHVPPLSILPPALHDTHWLPLHQPPITWSSRRARHSLYELPSSAELTGALALYAGPCPEPPAPAPTVWSLPSHSHSLPSGNRGGVLPCPLLPEPVLLQGGPCMAHMQPVVAAPEILQTEQGDRSAPELPARRRKTSGPRASGRAPCTSPVSRAGPRAASRQGCPHRDRPTERPPVIWGCHRRQDSVRQRRVAEDPECQNSPLLPQTRGQKSETASPL